MVEQEKDIGSRTTSLLELLTSVHDGDSRRIIQAARREILDELVSREGEVQELTALDARLSLERLTRVNLLLTFALENLTEVSSQRARQRKGADPFGVPQLELPQELIELLVTKSKSFLFREFTLKIAQLGFSGIQGIRYRRISLSESATPRSLNTYKRCLQELGLAESHTHGFIVPTDKLLDFFQPHSED